MNYTKHVMLSKYMSPPVLNDIGTTLGLSDGWSHSYYLHQYISLPLYQDSGRI